MKEFKNNFILCGMIGWSFEIIFTSIFAFLQRDYTLTGMTSLWMFPIYGSMAVCKPLCERIVHYPVVIRGLIYTLLFFTAEYLSGSFLNLFHVCPWDYSYAPLNFQGVIRADYAPFWFFAGLLYEKVLLRKEHA